jgi:hypothetical protein
LAVWALFWAIFCGHFSQKYLVTLSEIYRIHFFSRKNRLFKEVSLPFFPKTFCVDNLMMMNRVGKSKFRNLLFDTSSSSVRNQAQASPRLPDFS